MPFSATSSSFSWGFPDELTRPDGKFLQGVLGLYHVLCLEYLHKEASRKHPNKVLKPRQLNTKKQWFYDEFMPDV